MKHIKLFILLILILPLSMMAQKRKPWNKPLYDAYPWHFGFAFSGGLMDFSLTHAANFVDLEEVYSIEATPQPFFGASVVGNLKINDFFDLRFLPGLTFGQRKLTYFMKPEPTADTAYFHDMIIESTYLHFPLLVKYRAVRENNYRPYFIGGLNYTLDLAARKKIKDEEKPKIRLNAHDLYLEAGFGVDFYLPEFKFTGELKFSYGLMNMVSYDETEHTQAFDRLGSKMWTFAIYFE